MQELRHDGQRPRTDHPRVGLHLPAPRRRALAPPLARELPEGLKQERKERKWEKKKGRRGSGVGWGGVESVRWPRGGERMWTRLG